jgi:replicative DNA helicase
VRPRYTFVSYENRGSVTGLSAGFVELDRMTSGLHAAEMIVIAARPAMGKTAFAMNIAEHVSMDIGKAVAVFSLEMSSQQLVQRILCSRARVDLQRVRNGFLSERDFPNLTAAASQVGAAKIFFDDTPSLTISELGAKISVMTYHYEHTYDRLIELEPDKPPLTLQKAYAEVTGNADLQSYLGALERTPSSMKGDIIVVSFRFAYALAARD